MREGRVGRAADRDHIHLEARDGGENAEQFFRLAAVAEGEDDVAIPDHAEVAVKSVERVEDDGGRAGAGEGGGDLFPDVSGFPDPEDDHLAAGLDRFFYQIDGPDETFAQPSAEPLQLGNF